MLPRERQRMLNMTQQLVIDIGNIDQDILRYKILLDAIEYSKSHTKDDINGIKQRLGMLKAKRLTLVRRYNRIRKELGGY